MYAFLVLAIVGQFKDLSRLVAEDLLIHELRALARMRHALQPFAALSRQMIDAFIVELAGVPIERVAGKMASRSS